MSSIAIPPVTPTVKKIMILTIGLWLIVQVFLGQFLGVNQWRILILTPELVIEKFYVWQLLTYQFFHALSPSHLIFNMLMLWFSGGELEERWGKKFFIFYYLGSGIGAALIYCFGVGIYSAITGVRTPLTIPVLGASGALFGLLVAYGILFSDRVIYFMGLFPLKARYFVILLGAGDLLSLAGTGMGGGEVAYLAHLGGLVSGFLILRGHVQYKKMQTQAKLKKKSGGNLRLVVDNEKKENKDPKYWN